MVLIAALAFTVMIEKLCNQCKRMVWAVLVGGGVSMNWVGI
jgi:hypothetical protein